ncbi:MAG: hypothetical protein OXL97_10395 [Chloroflexota bacterium]|nr:hypothetical protein [Chloroflexota bacterium]MDE2886184.1 hypothetical protein [Chloroflexota bacterium]
MTTQPSTDLEQRVSRLEGAYEQVSERLGDLFQAIAGLRADMHAEIGGLRSEMNEGQAALRGEMNSRFNVLLVLLGTLWATTVGGFIALFTRL